MSQTPAPTPAQAKPQPAPLPPEIVDSKYGSAAEIMALPVAKLVAILKDPRAAIYPKAKACQRLAVTGDKTAVPALAALLADPQLSLYARMGLEPNPDPSAGEALRSALSTLKGIQLIGVINSIGLRKDSKGLDALSRLRYDSDPAVAAAADQALARVRPRL
ncbi:MAG: hypothetical protein JJE04_15995 [Acidobacteriia bacterium]|nr:hypothetical protein [Terriglobia bacterium]